MTIPTMVSIGEKIRKAREGKSLTIDQVQKETHIHSSVLNGIEQGHLDPALTPTYVRSYLKKYSQFLGLDPNEIVNEYSQLSPKPSAKPQAPQIVKPKEPVPAKRVDITGFVKIGKMIVFIAIGILIIRFMAVKAGEYFKKHSKPKAPVVTKKKALPAAPVKPGKTLKKQPDKKKAIKPAAPKSGSREALQKKAGIVKSEEKKDARETAFSEPRVLQVISAPESPPVARDISKPKPDSFSLVLRIKAAVLIEAKKDGLTLFKNVMYAGMEKTFNADEKIELLIAKGEAVELILDGKSLGSPGRGVFRDIEITKKGMKVRK